MFFEKNESLMSSGEFQCLGVKKLGRMFHIVAPVSRVRLSITHVVVRDIEGKDDGERKGREMGEERERRERRQMEERRERHKNSPLLLLQKSDQKKNS